MTTPSLRDAAQALITAVQEQHDTHEGVLKHAVPYGAVVALKEAIRRHDAALTEPAGWITMWPAMGGGRRQVFTEGAAKPSHGPELDSRLSITPVYAALAAPADAIGLAHEIWAVAQLGPDEGIEDGVARIAALLPGAPADALAEPVATIYTMEALVPGGSVKYHATVHKSLPAGTKLYTAPPATQLQQAVVRTIEECAVICEGMHEEDRPGDYAHAIRAKGQQ